MKRCGKCKREMPDTAFDWKKKGVKRSPRCRDCRKDYWKRYYKTNHLREVARITEYVAAQRQRLYAMLNSLKSRPCLDCGRRFNPWQMDFDHREGTVKIETVAALVRHGSEKKLLKETKKCDVVCACCHRQRTHERLRSR